MGRAFNMNERIALLIWTHGKYCQSVLRGITNYVRPTKPWIIRIAPPELSAIEHIESWKPTGLIGFLSDKELTQKLLRLKCPLVNVANMCDGLDVPRIGLDDLAIGKMAGEHLVGAGFRSFGYMGNPSDHFSNQREAAFKEVLHGAGFECCSFHEKSGEYKRGEWAPRSGLCEWLQALSKPVALLGANDARGWELAEACIRLGLGVPEQCAILGVDDDDLFCELSYPPLSSIALPGEKIGLEAATTLSHMLSGQPVHFHTLLIPPIGVITRRSTDIRAIEDKDVAHAVHFIQENLERPLNVNELLKVIPISRRLLEMKFRMHLNRTPAEEIYRVRIDRAKELLARGTLALHDVALNSGFSGAKQLSTVFRRDFGMTPTQYRYQFTQKDIDE